jgi:2-polyprenyl-6-hydroxyphenyl methylase/3-demethylubiquinone-9 3-methyltransferase
MSGYYKAKLSGDRLRRCYEIASPRVKQYLEAEIQFVLRHLRRNDVVLELGCGYGRVAFRLADVARYVIGIDTAHESLMLARQISNHGGQCELVEMDALSLAFNRSSFDKVVCIQNGICAFGVDRKRLLSEALRVARPGGTVLFSTYSELFWDDRLQWFAAQAAAGLVGPIDYPQTGNGEIVCTDGFRAGTVSAGAFRSLGAELGIDPMMTEVDQSSLFCEIIVPEAV